MEIVACPRCSMQVVLTNDGKCPACRFVADSAKAAAALAIDKAAYEKSVLEYTAWAQVSVCCPYCSTQVEPNNDGTCPRCRCIADSVKAIATLAHEEPHPDTSLPEVDYDELRLDQRKRTWKGYGWLAAAVCLCAVGVVLMFAAVITVAYLWNYDTAGSQRGKVAKYVLIVFGPIVTGSLSLGLNALHNARRYLQLDARLALLKDRRAPVLYLRSFRDDESNSSEFGIKKTIEDKLVTFEFHRNRSEESLTRSLSRCIGPVVAIGRPDELLPEIGAYRLYVSGDHWKAEVVKLMEIAQLVVMRLGASGGFLWEFKSAIKRVAPQRIILYSEPPGELPPHFQMLLIPGLKLPSSSFICFDDDWTPQSAESIDEILEMRHQYKKDYIRESVLLLCKISICTLIFIFLLWITRGGGAQY